MERIVIVGSGHAGFTLASQLRNKKFQGEIFLIDSQNELPYQRPPLSKDFLADSFKKERLYFKNQSFYIKNNIILINDTVSEISNSEKKIIFNDRRCLTYDKLVLALGSKSKKLTVLEGYNNVMHISDIESVDLLKLKLKSTSKLTIVGSGFISLEFASYAAKIGIETTVLVRGDNILSRSLSRDTSNIIKKYHMSKGINFIFEDEVESVFSDNGNIKSLVLKSQKIIDADLVLVAIGSLANDDLALNSNLPTDNGILVNENFKTLDDYIYAIGDCASFIIKGNYRNRLESVQNAIDQAKYLTSYFLKESSIFTCTPYFWSDQGELKIQSTGFFGDFDSNIIIGENVDHGIINFLFKDEILIAIESVNSPGVHILMKKIISDIGNRLITYSLLRQFDFDLTKLVNSIN
ncbi:FAD-dependent oxidoreductase [Providencia rettgeri]|uniref:NAD(P)/FAD-dependent oxidoreductase n=1 Tax=Providencia rettgeri TaxID=587 RepID=UPI0032DA33F1